MKGLLIAVLMIGLTACVTTTVYKNLTMMDKDKQKGKVQMGFEYETWQVPVANHKLAMAEVVAQCRDWHYENAILLGGLEYKCLKGDESDCKRYSVFYSYQCLTAEEVRRYQEGAPDLKDKQNSANQPQIESSVQ